MTIMPTGPDSAYPGEPICGDPHVDGCPSCSANYEEPHHLQRGATTCEAHYRCTDCRHFWVTSWGCN